MERLEGSFFAFDDTELFYQVWRPVGESRGSILISHGMAEHSECYDELATDLVGDKWTVYAWDLRGHGRSEGKRGFIRDFNDYRRDLESFIGHVKSLESTNNRVRFLFGHSMGGLITLQLLLDSPPQGFRGFICSSPALGLSIQVPQLKRRASDFLAKWAPRISFFNEIKYTDLHRDQERLKQYSVDPLRHDKISPGLFIGMMKAMEDVGIRAHEIHQPMFFQLSGDERIVDSKAATEVFDKLSSKDKKLIVYPESLHEIYNDQEREQVIRDLKFFLKEHEAKPL